MHSGSNYGLINKVFYYLTTIIYVNTFCTLCYIILYYLTCNIINICMICT